MPNSVKLFIQPFYSDSRSAVVWTLDNYFLSLSHADKMILLILEKDNCFTTQSKVSYEHCVDGGQFNLLVKVQGIVAWFGSRKSHDRNDAKTFDWSYNCIYCTFSQWGGFPMHTDIIMMIVFLIEIQLFVTEKYSLGDIFLPCNPRNCAPRSGSPRPCRRRRGTTRGHCCRILK